MIDFTVNRVPFWGNIPEASFEPSDELSIRSSFVLVGLVHSVCPISIANRAYRDRFALKFVPEIAQRIEADTQQYGDVENSGNLPKVTRRVIKEFLPKWDHLFD